MRAAQVIRGPRANQHCTEKRVRLLVIPLFFIQPTVVFCLTPRHCTNLIAAAEYCLAEKNRITARI